MRCPGSPKPASQSSCYLIPVKVDWGSYNDEVAAYGARWLDLRSGAFVRNYAEPPDLETNRDAYMDLPGKVFDLHLYQRALVSAIVDPVLRQALRDTLGRPLPVTREARSIARKQQSLEVAALVARAPEIANEWDVREASERVAVWRCLAGRLSLENAPPWEAAAARVAKAEARIDTYLRGRLEAIDAWFRANVPALFVLFRPPALREELDALAAEVGYELDPALRLLFSWHDGVESLDPLLKDMPFFDLRYRWVSKQLSLFVISYEELARASAPSTVSSSRLGLRNTAGAGLQSRVPRDHRFGFARRARS